MTRDTLQALKNHVEEILTEDDLQEFLNSNIPLKHYIGFEISGPIHLGSGLMSMMVIKELQKLGAECTIFLADWHTWINDKLGGDQAFIREIATEYFKEGMIAAMKCVGGDPSSLKFVLGTDLYHQQDAYWETVIEVAKHTSLSRMQRSITIMGRTEGGDVDFAKLIYPAMQVADVFFMERTIAHAGMDQRKAHVIVRDVADKLKSHGLKRPDGKPLKPVAIHQPLLLGIGKPSIWPVPKEKMQEFMASMKMSKSKPDSAIFLHDSEEEIRRKVRKAFCPERETAYNPILNWTKFLVYGIRDDMTIERDAKNGGTVTYPRYAELETAYASGALHPMDLKENLSNYLVSLLAPARMHFSTGMALKGWIKLQTRMKT